MFKIINFVLLDIAWIVTILSAAKGIPIAGVIFTLTWLVLHLCVMSDQPVREIKLVVFSIITAVLLENLLVLGRAVTYPEQALFGSPVPLWMICLWINLALTINSSLSWFQKKYVISGIMGSIAGPIAYMAGMKLGAIVLIDITSIIAISCLWLFAMPLLIWFNDYLSQREIPVNKLVAGNSE